MELKCKGCRAFSFVDFIMIVVVLAVLAFVMLPLIAKRYAKASKVSCTNQLKQIGLAYRMWAIDNGDRFPMQVAVTNGGVMELIQNGLVYPTYLVMSNELNTPKLLICPAESDRRRVVANSFDQSAPTGATHTYERSPFTNDNNVSYFVGVDADGINPTTLLGGDDNFIVNGINPKSGLLLLQTNIPVSWTDKRHKKRGNLLFADGAVTGTTNPGIQTLLINTGIATNRLALP